MINISTMASTGTTLISVTSESRANFEKLVHKAINNWIDAPPEIKEFCDLYRYGTVRQDYYAMMQVPRPNPDTAA